MRTSLATYYSTLLGSALAILLSSSYSARLKQVGSARPTQQPTNHLYKEIQGVEGGEFLVEVNIWVEGTVRCQRVGQNVTPAMAI